MRDGPPEPRQEDVDSRSSQEDAPATPFDNPFFLPVLFLAGSLWFGYDGWLNDDPDMQQHLTFNRVGFMLLLPLTIWTWLRALARRRAEQVADPPSSGP